MLLVNLLKKCELDVFKSKILFLSLFTHFVVQPFILPQENPCHSEMKNSRISREISGAMECSEGII